MTESVSDHPVSFPINASKQPMPIWMRQGAQNHATAVVLDSRTARGSDRKLTELSYAMRGLRRFDNLSFVRFLGFRMPRHCQSLRSSGTLFSIKRLDSRQTRSLLLR
jgi:hypothetical protein